MASENCAQTLHELILFSTAYSFDIKFSLEILGRTQKFWTVPSGKLSKFGQKVPIRLPKRKIDGFCHTIFRANALERRE